MTNIQSDNIQLIISLNETTEFLVCITPEMTLKFGAALATEMARQFTIGPLKYR